VPIDITFYCGALFDSLDFPRLPVPVILAPTHDFGIVIIRTCFKIPDKSEFQNNSIVAYFINSPVNVHMLRSFSVS
jgi:hypothetical protein